MLLLFGLRRNTHGVALVALGELGDGGGNRCREHQRPAVVGCRFEDEF
jgi:hypothetical protein